MDISNQNAPSRNQRAPLLIHEPIAKALLKVRSLEPQRQVLPPLGPPTEEPQSKGSASQPLNPKGKKKVRSKAESFKVPSKLLLSPKFRTVPTILTAPKNMSGASKKTKAAFRAAGALYELASPPTPTLPDLAPLPEKRHTWFNHDHDVLYFPCPVNNNADSVYKKAQYVLMEDIRYYTPRSLSKAIVPLARAEIFPSLKFIYLSSGLIYANSNTWTPNAITQFFGSDYLLLVDLLNPIAVLNMRIKLRDLNLLDETQNNSSWICDKFEEKHGRFSWLCEEFDDTVARFLQPAYWQELNETFQGMLFLHSVFRTSDLFPKTKARKKKPGKPEKGVAGRRNFSQNSAKNTRWSPT